LSWIIARRRRPAAGYAALLLGLVIVAALYAGVTGSGGAQAASTTGSSGAAAGQKLFITNCSSCHGLEAQGSSQAPSLVGAGAAAVDFQMSTGRMPCSGGPSAQCPEHPVKYSQQQIYDIADYIAGLGGGGGPAIPDSQQVSTVGANTALGYQLFSTNCAQCHGFAGAGGALTYGKYAPSLVAATPTQIYEAMLTGPEAMPVFGDGVIPPQAKRDIIAYVEQTKAEPNPGGFSLGRTGTVTEGLLAWLGGLGFLVLIAMWITARRRKPHAIAAAEANAWPAEEWPAEETLPIETPQTSHLPGIEH
jgi:ubiquinol-cytochrome c reductase cytochrome c subunit